jgi:hypothetical protein
VDEHHAMIDCRTEDEVGEENLIASEGKCDWVHKAARVGT